MPYDVFISYASNDRESASSYAQLLQSFGVTTWYDQNGGTEEHIFKQIADALRQSSFVLLLWSRHAAGSSFVEREIFLAEELGKKVIPVKLDSRPLSAQMRLILARTKLIDARTRIPQRELLDVCERINPPKLVAGPAFLFLNMKGGVGKTTLAANIGGTLHGPPFNKSVLLIDLDAQANLSNLLLNESEYVEAVSADRSVISCFEQSQADGHSSPSDNLFGISSDAIAPKPTQLAYNLRNPMTDRRFDLIVGQFELFKYSLSRNFAHLARCEERFAAFVTWARKQYDVVILDAAPSNSFVTECAIRSATDIVAPTTPDKYALRGIQAIGRLMDEGMELQKARPIHVLRNAVGKDPDTPEQTICDAYPVETLASRIRGSTYMQVKNADPSIRVRDPLAELAFFKARRDMKEALSSVCDELLRRYEAQNRNETTKKVA